MILRFTIIVSFMLMLNPVLLIAQDEAVPLIEKMQKTKGHERIDLLNEISVVYRKTDRMKSMDYAGF